METMNTYQYEAMDNTGLEIKDTVEANSEKEAIAKIREMGFFVTKIRSKQDTTISLQKESDTFSLTIEECDNRDILSLLVYVVVFAVGFVIGLITGCIL